MNLKSFCPKAVCAACAANKNRPNRSTRRKSGSCRRRRKELVKLTKLQSTSEIQIVEYILDHLYKSSDLFLGRQNKVVRHTGCSKAQVFKVFRALQEDGLIVKLDNSVWQVNPPLLDLAIRQRRWWKCNVISSGLTAAVNCLWLSLRIARSMENGRGWPSNLTCCGRFAFSGKYSPTPGDVPKEWGRCYNFIV